MRRLRPHEVKVVGETGQHVMRCHPDGIPVVVDQRKNPDVAKEGRPLCFHREELCADIVGRRPRWAESGGEDCDHMLAPPAG
jgi:hypothetical protein